MNKTAEIIPEKGLSYKTDNRIQALDLLRGGAMILVVLYHILYDLKYIFGSNIPYFLTPGSRPVETVHICFLWVLFAVSGICSGFSRNCLKRGAVLYILGWLITLVTSCAMPSELIVFGVLSCFGSCMVITSLAKPLTDKLPWQGLLILSAVLWFVFRDFHRSGELSLIFARIKLPVPPIPDYLYPIGIKAHDFKSSDYFPIIPYIFMFLSGCALYAPVSMMKLPAWFYKTGRNIFVRIISFIGRHSLVIYIVHQPVLLGVLTIFFG